MLQRLAATGVVYSRILDSLSPAVRKLITPVAVEDRNIPS